MLSRHSLKELIELSWKKLVEDKKIGVRATIGLKCEQRFGLDVEKITIAVQTIVEYLLANIDEDSQISVFDRPVLINSTHFLEVSFLAELLGGIKYNPQLQLAYAQQIIEAHGGRLEFKTSDPTQFTCNLFLPMLADSRPQVSG